MYKYIHIYIYIACLGNGNIGGRDLIRRPSARTMARLQRQRGGEGESVSQMGGEGESFVLDFIW